MRSFFCNHYVNSDPSPRVQRFVDAWSGVHNGSLPGTTCAALGYDAAGLALDALKRAKTPTPLNMRNAIDATVGYEGVTGRISLKGRHGNPAKRVLVLRLTGSFPARQSYVKAYRYADLFPSRRRRSASLH